MLRPLLAVRDPADPEAKPPSVATVVQGLPAGTRIDTAAVARCAATDGELIARGAAACPEPSRVGGGSLDTDSGQAIGPVPRILMSRVTLFNAAQEMILFTESTNAPGMPVRTSTRVRIEGTRLTTEVPPVPTEPSSDPFCRSSACGRPSTSSSVTSVPTCAPPRTAPARARGARRPPSPTGTACATAT